VLVLVRGRSFCLTEPQRNRAGTRTSTSLIVAGKLMAPNATESCWDEDKHKASTHPYIHPLSLQDRGPQASHAPMRPETFIRV
jgi:hypothetical protein